VLNPEEFRAYKGRLIGAMREVISERGKDAQVSEAAFPAYTDSNFLIRFLFWRRLWLTANYLEAHGPYESVLDFGCGSGVFMPLLAKFAGSVVGIDVDITTYRDLSTHFSFSSELTVYDVNEKPLCSFADKSFDAIVAMDVLEHVEKLDDVFGEFRRVTRPGGMVIISGPTESLIYKIGRRVAGKEYTGNYHIRNIYDIRKVMKDFFQTKTLATLYYPFPLFRILVGYVSKTPGKTG
jgi:2-polyprenyl-3-methyl-5-hydroxy-6-metoxy-1,4-benzoquinol methylase